MTADRWLIRRHDPGEHDEPVVAEGLSEVEARRRATEFNRRLNLEEGVPIRSPFRFYFVGNANDSDAGIYTRAIADATAREPDREPDPIRQEDDEMITFPGIDHTPPHPDAIGTVGDMPRERWPVPTDAAPVPTQPPELPPLPTRACAWCADRFQSPNPARLKCDACQKLKTRPGAARPATPKPVAAPVAQTPAPPVAADKVEPAHYCDMKPEPLEVIEDWSLGFCLGNVVKYVARAGKKPGESALDDLKKAAQYLARHIARLEQKP
jgi:hypothetical protein